MYLYDKNDDKIEVYSMEPNKEKIYKFKKDQMESMPVDERILKAVTNGRPVLEKFYSDYECVYYNHVYYERKEIFKKVFHNLTPYILTNNELIRQEKILEKYYQYPNAFLGEKLITLEMYINANQYKAIKYLLLTKRNYDYTNGKSDFKIMDDIILLNKKLYLLELILRGEFERINKEEIEDFLEQFSLFDFSNKPIKTLDINELKKADEINLCNHSLENQALIRVEKSQKVLKYIKK